MSQTKAQLIDNLVQPITGALGSASAPTFSFTSDPNSGLYSPGADQVAISTGGTGRLFVDASGNVGIGTASPSSSFHVLNRGLFDTANSGVSGNVGLAVGNIGVGFNWQTGNALSIHTANSERLRIDASGCVGIGTTNPISLLDVTGNVGTYARIRSTDGAFAAVLFQNSDTGTTSGDGLYVGINSNEDGYVWNYENKSLLLGTNSIERARIDSSGRLLVGTSSGSDNNALLKVQGNVGGSTGTGWIDVRRGLTTPVANSQLGLLSFSDASGNHYAFIEGFTDAGTGTNDYPGRLVFSTTADGASSPTERMRIRNTGQVWINQTGNISGTGDTVLLQATANGADYTCAFANSNASAYGIYVKYGTDVNTTTNSFLLCQGASTTRVDLRSNGGIANYQANNVNLSDINTKKDIAPAAGTWDCIKEWEIVNYRYKEQRDDADLNLGVIAQQVAESCPEVITVFQEAKEATEDAPAQEERLGVKEQQMYWMAIKALQEAQVRIEALEAEIAALKAQ